MERCGRREAGKGQIPLPRVRVAVGVAVIVVWRGPHENLDEKVWSGRANRRWGRDPKKERKVLMGEQKVRTPLSTIIVVIVITIR